MARKSLPILRSEFEKLIDSFFSDLEEFFETPFRTIREPEKYVWAVRVDMYDDGQNIVIKADIPGVEQKDIEISIKDRFLTIKGKREIKEEEKDKNYYKVERWYGEFQRTLQLPASVNIDQAKAVFKDGVLTITLPKAESEKEKKIKIE